VFTGILPVCKNDDGLASVMGHGQSTYLVQELAQLFADPWQVSAFRDCPSRLVSNHTSDQKFTCTDTQFAFPSTQLHDIPQNVCLL
jgi:hypothetical protein